MRTPEEFFAALYDGAIQPVLVYNRSGAPIFCNRSAGVLLRQMKISDAAFFERIAADGKQCLEEQCGRAIGLCLQQEVIDLLLTPYLYKNTFYIVAQVEEASARYLQQDLLRVLRNSGAKMNSYLNGIYGAAQRLGLETEEGERLGKDVHHLLRMKNHLYQLLDRSGTKDYLVPIELAPFIREYVRSIVELKPDLYIRALDVQPGLYVRMMPEDMELVLSVLVSNAYRFGNGEIVLSAERKGEKICFSVLDNGPGPEDPSRLYEWGYRTADRKGGRGLGFSLAMAKQLLESQGAELEYTRVGEQTCFTVTMEPSDLPYGSVLAEWAAEPLSNSLSQLRIELSDIL